MSDRRGARPPHWWYRQTGQKGAGSGGSAGSRQAGSTLCHLLARPPDWAGGALKRIPARPWGLSHFICEIFWRDDPKNGEGSRCEECSSGFCVFKRYGSSPSFSWLHHGAASASLMRPVFNSNLRLFDLVEWMLGAVLQSRLMFDRTWHYPAASTLLLKIKPFRNSVVVPDFDLFVG